jgi:hypothetical protein
MSSRNFRLAIIGSSLWLLPALSCTIWYAANPGPVVPASWVRDALALLMAGLGAWILLLIVAYRGRFPYAGIVVSAAFIVLNLAADVLLFAPSNATELGSHLVDMLPTYVALGGLCMLLDRMLRKAKTN